jgi:hypothetical protein
MRGSFFLPFVAFQKRDYNFSKQRTQIHIEYPEYANKTPVLQ